MTAKKLATAAIGAAVALLIADAALAQAAPPKPAATTGAAVPPLAPAPPKITNGPAIPGVCIFSNQRAIFTSAVGKYMNTRLQALTQQVTAELSAEQTGIEAEKKAIETASQQPGADQSALQQRADIWQARLNAFQRKAQQREREMQLTQQKAVNRIGQEMDPVLIQVYQSRACSVLLNGDSVMLGNPAMDITDAVIAGTNAKIQSFAFDRERLDQQATAPTAVPPKK